ncbi:macrophage colony-stimulating factor 1a isoform X2 [Conger conger]|uniref:macrophage colony-stimulating factor 1a isoform X2 n=1 Tax=Conger conger TaxID=82655 RepID=UPI002A5A18F7|nr:macrophage colony-stimulating factor 1a isoform X2 [Conger conger]
MNTHKQSHTFCKAKAWRQCFSLMMCFHVVLGDVPGPCKHSVTKEHLQNIQGLIDNQLQNDCSIAYTFMERQSLSKVCYVKAAFPQILELLKAHFQYSPSSDNYRYVSTLKMLVLNIYSHKCIPEINEEIEDDPVRFAKEYSSSRREAVGKIKKVLQLYMELMTENNKPVDWNCEEEYAEDYPELTTALAKSTGPTSGITADLLDSDSDRDSGKAFRNGTRGGSHISYKIAFITASVCGGLLLLITLYCFRKQKKLKALLHSSKVKENQRLTSDSKDIEMQDYEITEQSCLDST